MSGIFTENKPAQTSVVAVPLAPCMEAKPGACQRSCSTWRLLTAAPAAGQRVSVLRVKPPTGSLCDPAVRVAAESTVEVRQRLFS